MLKLLLSAPVMSWAEKNQHLQGAMTGEEDGWVHKNINIHLCHARLHSQYHKEAWSLSDLCGSTSQAGIVDVCLAEDKKAGLPALKAKHSA